MSSGRSGAAACDWVAEKKKEARRNGKLTARIGSLQNPSDPAMWETAIQAVSQTHGGSDLSTGGLIAAAAFLRQHLLTRAGVIGNARQTRI